MREQLVANNRAIQWVPEHIREGRMGDWLENNVDWSLSRYRYWATPLPIWECESCKKQVCVVFRILMGVIGFNLMNLFLNSENCRDFEAFSLKSWRQRKPPDRNPEMIIYTETAFAVLRLSSVMPMMLGLPGKARAKLAAMFRKIDLSPAPV